MLEASSIRHEPAGAGPEKGHGTDQRAVTSLLCGKDVRVGVVQFGGEKTLGCFVAPSSM